MNIELLGASGFSFLLIIVFTILIIKYFILLKNKQIDLKLILFFLRLITLVLLSVLILNPWINWNRINYSIPDLNIYLDNSKSIAFVDTTIDFNSKIKYINHWAKSNNVQADWYLFGDSLRQFHGLESLFEDSYSSLSGLNKKIVLEQNANHLIITDGHINRGKSIDDFEIDNNNIYIAGVGTDITYNDCYIDSIQVDDENEKKISLSIRLGCLLEENKAISIDCILSNDNEMIRKESFMLNFKNGGYQDINFKDIGKEYLSDFNIIQIETDFKEFTYNNNWKSFIYNNNEKRDNVLLITGGLSSNTKFIKKVIKDKFPYLDLHHHFQGKNIDYSKVLNEYSLIILDNFPFSSNHLKDYHYIIDNYFQIPIIYFQGPGLEMKVAEHIAKKNNLELIFPKNVSADLELRNNYSMLDAIDFGKFPPINKNMFWTSNELFYEPITYFSNQTIAALKNDKKTVVFISNLANANLVESNLFNTENVVDYTYNLILNEYEPGSELISLTIDQDRYDIESKINTCISFEEKIADSDFRINIYDLEDNLYDKIILDTDMVNGCGYNFQINDLGDYYIQVLSQNDNSVFKSNKKYISIRDFNIELEFLYQNKKSIHDFKNRNNAVYFDFKYLEDNLNKIILNEIVNVKQSNFSSLSTQYYWFLFIIFLSLEWYLRKKSKLL